MQQFDPNQQQIAQTQGQVPAQPQQVVTQAPIQAVDMSTQPAQPAQGSGEEETLNAEGLAVLNQMPIEEVSEDADASDMPPPIPPGIYPAKAVLEKVSELKYSKSNIPFVTITLITVINAPNEWFHGAQRKYYATTLIRETAHGKTSPADDLIKALQGNKVNGATGQKVQLIQSLLQSERDIGVEVDWEASPVPTAEQLAAVPKVYPPSFYRTASQFPTDQRGNPLVVEVAPDGQTPARTRDKIRRVVYINDGMNLYAQQQAAKAAQNQAQMGQMGQPQR
jgi:hypothetical protein